MPRGIPNKPKDQDGAQDQAVATTAAVTESAEQLTGEQTQEQNPEIGTSDQTGQAESTDPVAHDAPRDYTEYVTKEKQTIPIDILIKGQMILGNWSPQQGYVEFKVPNELVEAFELHHHFAVGNVVKK